MNLPPRQLSLAAALIGWVSPLASAGTEYQITVEGLGQANPNPIGFFASFAVGDPVTLSFRVDAANRFGVGDSNRYHELVESSWSLDWPGGSVGLSDPGSPPLFGIYNEQLGLGCAFTLGDTVSVNRVQLGGSGPLGLPLEFGMELGNAGDNLPLLSLELEDIAGTYDGVSSNPMLGSFIFEIEEFSPATEVEFAFSSIRIEEVSLGTSYCTAATNSAGTGAEMSAAGSLAVADSDFTLQTTGLPDGVPAIYFFGANQIRLPFGDGFRCVGGPIERINPTLVTTGGVTSRQVDLSSSAQFVPGASLNFQLWYRDPMAMMSGFNLSNGLGVDFH